MQWDEYQKAIEEEFQEWEGVAEEIQGNMEGDALVEAVWKEILNTAVRGIGRKKISEH